jgi:propanediol dehydratase large subunit
MTSSMAKQKKKRPAILDQQVERHIASGFRLFEACRYPAPSIEYKTQTDN